MVIHVYILRYFYLEVLKNVHFFTWVTCTKLDLEECKRIKGDNGTLDKTFTALSHVSLKGAVDLKMQKPRKDCRR